MSWRRALLWVVLAVPAGLMIQSYLSGSVLAMDLYHPSGEMAVRLTMLALLPGPLTDIFGPNRFLRGWIAIRRNLGVAAFLYALLHLVFYVLDMRMLSAMLDEITIPGIWSGWLAFLLMLVPAAISTNVAMRALGRRWKTLQRLVYPAFLIGLLHWLWLGWDWAPAAIHLAPIMLVWLLRLGVNYARETQRRKL